MKAIFATALSALALVCAVAPSGANEKIDRTCDRVGCVLAFDGEIVQMDAALIQRAILESPHAVGMITFNSPGGDPFEALKISDVLNSYFVAFATGECPGDNHPCQAITAGDTCASACALIYMTANDRSGTEVFVHRPTFSVAAFKKMSAARAEAAYNRTTGRLLKELRNRGILENDIEMLMSIPSADVQKLSPSYPGHSTWMAEWLAAKCGNGKPVTDFNQLWGQVLAQTDCETSSLHAEQLRAQHRNS